TPPENRREVSETPLIDAVLADIASAPKRPEPVQVNTRLDSRDYLVEQLREAMLREIERQGLRATPYGPAYGPTYRYSDPYASDFCDICRGMDPRCPRRRY